LTPCGDRLIILMSSYPLEGWGEVIGVDGVRTPSCFRIKRPFERTSCAMQVGALHLAFGGRTAMHNCYAPLQRVGLSR